MKGYIKPPKAIHGRYRIFGRAVYLCGRRGAKPRVTEIESEITCDNCLSRLAHLDRELELERARARRLEPEPEQVEIPFEAKRLRLVR